VSPPVYEERLRAPLRVWLAVLGVSVVAAATLHAGAGGARAVVPYVVVPPLAAVVLLLRSRGRVRVADGVLHVPGARIPLDHVGGVRPLDEEGTRRVRGPAADPRAYVATRAWLATSVQVWLEDPSDDTPYWVVGTRDPEALAAALRGRPNVSPPSDGAGPEQR
jgi:hypothetical protein